jgi:sugar (pentulose or hexulose) kinase
VALYDESLQRLALASTAVVYKTSAGRVEFDPSSVVADVLRLVGQCGAGSEADTRRHHATIVLTGQAESPVLATNDMTPVRPGISWMDGRASQESAEIEASATWPASKLRWLARHEPLSRAGAGSARSTAG